MTMIMLIVVVIRPWLPYHHFCVVGAIQINVDMLHFAGGYAVRSH